MKSNVLDGHSGLTLQQQARATHARMVVASFVTATMASPAFAQLTEAENTTSWVLNIFSPALLLTLLTIGLIGCGITVWLGKLSIGMFMKILIGSVLVFGARTLGPKLIALF